MRRIKNLHVLWSGEIGGTEEFIITLIRNFNYTKYDIHLCFLYSRGLIFDEASRLNNVNVTFIGLKNGYDITGALRFAHYLYKNKFDIIHLHMRNFLATAVIAFFALRIPVIMTHHIGPVDVRLFKKNRVFYKLFSRFFRKIIAISKTVKDNLILDLGVKRADKIEVIHNCIDLNKFKKPGTLSSDLTWIKGSGKYIIGFIGRMEYFKRPLLFIEVASEILKQNGEYYFIMVGDGPEFAACKKMIDNYNIGDHIRLLGFRRDIPDVLRLFDALLFTSVGEGFGIVLLEAMAMGVAVFAVNDGAVPEIISDKVNGILFDTDDPGIIAREILKVQEDTQLVNNIKKRCVEDVYEKFSVNTCIREIETVYDGVL